MTTKTPAPIAELRPGDLLTDVEVSALLGVSRITLANWRCEGKGPRFRKIGERMVRYLRADVIAFIGGDADTSAKAAAKSG